MPPNGPGGQLRGLPQTPAEAVVARCLRSVPRSVRLAEAPSVQRLVGRRLELLMAARRAKGDRIEECPKRSPGLCTAAAKWIHLNVVGEAGDSEDLAETFGWCGRSQGVVGDAADASLCRTIYPYVGRFA